MKAKLATLVVTAVATSVMLVSLVSAWRDAERRFTAKRAELLGVASTIATSVAHPLETGDSDNVARTLSAIGRIPGITFARVTGREGKTVHQFGFGVVVKRAPGLVSPNPEIGPLSVFHLQTYPVATPIISGGVQIGNLTLIADLSELRSALRESLLSALLAGVVASAIGLLLSRRLQRGIADPVASLTQAMDEVAKSKNFDRAVVKTSNDEIGRLVDSFNAMLSEVRTRDEALAVHRDNLEKEVDLRTRQYQEARQVAEAASGAKSEFLATMSHEIRTPMNGMLVMAELLASGSLTPRLQRYADVLLNSGQSLLAIINDILDFSKIEAGKMELECVPVDLRRTIDDTLQLFNGRAVSKGIELAGDVDPDVAQTIAADPVRLTQIVSNLINNALKFTDSGRVLVHINTCAAPDGNGRAIEIHVADTGIGIPADKLATIFEAFSQSDQATTRRFGGTGLGLTICRRLVAAMGGGIRVTSEAGSGSTFTVQVPIVVLSEPATPLVLKEPTCNRLVLAMEASAMRDILARAAKRRGLEPVTAEPGEITNETLQHARGVVIGSGDAALVRNVLVSARAVSKQMVVIALAAFGSAGSTELESDSRVDQILDSPLTFSDRETCLDHIVSGRNALRRGFQLQSQTVFNVSRDLSRLRVLAADDNPVNREVLSEALKRLGAQVVCVENGAAAVAAVEAQRFDIVLMDCSMPVMDGFTATRCIREWEQRNGCAPRPIIALTAYVIGEVADAWRDAGMTGYLTKPYTLKALAECLERSGALDHTAVSSEGRFAMSEESDSAFLAQSEIDVETEYVDGTALEGIRDMERPGENLVNRIVELYVTHAATALDAIIAQLPNGAPDEIAEAAHALRSMSRNIGATRMANLCTALEQEARRGDRKNFTAYGIALTTALPVTLKLLAPFVTHDTATDCAA